MGALRAPCPECGFDRAGLPTAEIGATLRMLAVQLESRLGASIDPGSTDMATRASELLDEISGIVPVLDSLEPTESERVDPTGHRGKVEDRALDTAHDCVHALLDLARRPRVPAGSASGQNEATTPSS